MPNLTIRLTSDADTRDRLLKAVRALEGIERAEEVADLMDDMHRDDSSSAELPDDTGPGSHVLVFETDTERTATLALRAAEELSRREGAAMEIVEPRT